MGSFVSVQMSAANRTVVPWSGVLLDQLDPSVELFNIE